MSNVTLHCENCGACEVDVSLMATKCPVCKSTNTTLENDEDFRFVDIVDEDLCDDYDDQSECNF